MPINSFTEAIFFAIDIAEGNSNLGTLFDKNQLTKQKLAQSFDIPIRPQVLNYLKAFVPLFIKHADDYKILAHGLDDGNWFDPLQVCTLINTVTSLCPDYHIVSHVRTEDDYIICGVRGTLYKLLTQHSIESITPSDD